MNINAGAQIPLCFVATSPHIQTLVAVRGDTIKRLARISEITFETEAPAGSVQLVVRGQSAALPLSGLIDFTVERARLTKEIEKWQAEVDKIDARFANADFVARAKDEVIEENRERRRESVARIVKLRQALAGLETESAQTRT